MATGGFDSITNSIKSVYSPANVEAMVNVDMPFTRWVDSNINGKGQVHTVGGNLKMLANLESPQNFSYIADGDSYSVPKDRTDIQLTLNPVLIAGTSQIGEMTRYAANTHESAFNKGEYFRRMDESMKDTAKHIERMYCASHGTGRVAVVESDDTNAFVAAEHEGVQLLRVNMRCSVRTSDGGDGVRDNCDVCKITKIVRSTRTVTYTFDAGDSDKTLVAGDSVHVVNAASQTSLSSISPNGLRGLIDDATFSANHHGQSRATYIKLKSEVAGNGGTDRELNEAIIDELLQRIYHQSGGAPTDFWAGTGQGRMFMKFISPDRRFQSHGEGMKYRIGWQDSSFVYDSNWGPIPLHTAPDILPREIYAVDASTLVRYQAKKLGWWEAGNGAGGLLPVAGTNTYKAAWFMANTAVENLGCSSPIRNGVIRDLRDPLFDGAL